MFLHWEFFYIFEVHRLVFFKRVQAGLFSLSRFFYLDSILKLLSLNYEISKHTTTTAATYILAVWSCVYVNIYIYVLQRFTASIEILRFFI